MTAEPWLLGSTVLLCLLYTAVLFHLYQLRKTTPAHNAGAESANTDSPMGESKEGITCPSCGSTNNPEYRFCRECVGELPGRHAHWSPSDIPTGRSIR